MIYQITGASYLMDNITQAEALRNSLRLSDQQFKNLYNSNVGDQISIRNNHNLLSHDAFIQCLNYLASHNLSDATLKTIFSAPIRETFDIMQIILYYSHPRVPFYSLGELSDLIDEFIDHIKSDATSLITTGYPTYRFSKSIWLDWRLNQHYPVKIPIHIKREATDTGEKCHYYWTDVIREHPYIHELDLGTSFMGNLQMTPKDNNESLGTTQYNDAPTIQGLTIDEIYYIGKIRPDFFKLKTDILELAYDAIKDESCNDLMENVSHEIQRYFNNGEFNFMCHMDFHKYRNTYMNIPAHAHCPIGEIYGGVASLMNLIGHVGAEIQIGEICRTREILDDLIVCDGGRIYFEPSGEWFSEKEQRLLMEGYRLGNKLSTETVNYMQLFEKRVRELLVISSEKSTTFAHKMIDRNFFSINSTHKTCDIVFQGKRASIPLSRGLTMLARLFQHPNVKFNCVDVNNNIYEPIDIAQSFKQIYEKKDCANDNNDDDTGTDKDTSYNIRTTQELNSLSGFGEQHLIDESFINKSNQKIKQLESSRREQIKLGNTEKAKEIRMEIKKISIFLRKAMKKGGKIASFATEQDDARTNVYNNIKNARTKIHDAIPELANHIYDHVTASYECTYDPDQDMHWDVEIINSKS